MSKRFFASDPLMGEWDLFATEAEAKARVEEWLSSYSDFAGEGWPDEDMESICYGKILGGVTETVRMPWAKWQESQGFEPSDNPEFDEYLEYQVKEETNE